MVKKKGSALLMVLIALMVLSLIGTAIISYSFSNFKLRKQVSDSYADRYIAEGGIDQSYGAIVKLSSEVESGTTLNALKSKIETEFNNKSNSYFDNLYNGDLKISISSQINTTLKIVVTSTYKNNETVIGNFEIIGNGQGFSVALTEKIFK
ncbi:hypothetical protein [Clostridium grantii]|uniref:Type 4 fimbrial biogenesis protein PilX N-terminal domain-containing protein n=1 Tax=Clostridium grantii DSM 8605 TaxID=1121316 RepID=A0A1M5RIC7_9CLOT|nr:hypothetical protein [Clostridium grantii]SHH25910.1 hypothetical protein SAMN02745207_00544 [Clostridium grantii DSM 8605]